MMPSVDTTVVHRHIRVAVKFTAPNFLLKTTRRPTFQSSIISGFRSRINKQSTGYGSVIAKNGTGGPEQARLSW